MHLTKTKDSKGNPSRKDSLMMKISLFIKPFTMKVCLSLVLFIYIVGQPSYAQAGFFSDLITQVFGQQTQASEPSPVAPEVVHNSQNVPLLESSINPDLKNMKDEPVAPTLSPSDPVALANSGALGIDSELEKYASSEKISTYVVKEGDTIEGISNKLKVSKSTIIASNADLKKSDLLKIGQKLVIITLKSDAIDTTDKKISSTDKPKDEVVVKKDEPKVEPKDEGPTFTINTDLPSPSAPQVQAPVVNLSVPVDTTIPPTTLPVVDYGQPTGTINGGYIWPFPGGIGRISQGLHADNAYDFSSPKNTPIFAIQNGTVFIVHPTGYNGGYGKYVVINFDDGRQAIFGHMNKTAVEEGQIVKQGDIIGYVGSTGKSTGPHTHIGFHGSLGNPYLGLKVNSTSDDFHD